MTPIERHLQKMVILASFMLIGLSAFLSACVAANLRASIEVDLGTLSSDHQAQTKLRAAGRSSAGLLPAVAVDNTMSSPDYGMQVFLYWHEEIADRDLRLVQDAGFRWVKQEIAWREVEGGGRGMWRWNHSDRVIDQIEAHDLKVIVRLGSQPAWAAADVPFPNTAPPDDLQDFYNYVYAVASRYQGRVEAYQIWNEPNLAREWGGRSPNPAEYVELLKVGHRAVKAADPSAVVISAGLAPTTQNNSLAMPDIYYLQGMYDAGASPYFQALGVHAAGYKSPPELDPGVIATTPELHNYDRSPEELRRAYGFRHVEDIREIMVLNGDEAKKVVLLEFGWTIDPRPDSPYYWHAVTPEQQDKYLQRAYAYAAANWQPWIGVMSVIYIADPQWTREDEQTYWSIIYPGYPALHTAPAYYGLFYMAKVPAVEARAAGPN